MAALLQHRSAGQVPDAQGFAPAQLLTFARATVRHPAWLAGIGCNALGLPLNRWLRAEPITLAELGWAAALVAGLVGFLVASAVEVTGAPADTGPAVVAGVLAVVVVGSLTVTARQRGRGRAATLLGCATGVAYAFTATLIKACTNVLSQGPSALLGSWQLYTLLVSGVVGLLLNQLAYQAGPLAVSLPVITVIDPLLAVLLGVVIYDENLRHTPLALAGEILFLTVLALAATALTRFRHAPRTL